MHRGVLHLRTGNAFNHLRPDQERDVSICAWSWSIIAMLGLLLSAFVDPLGIAAMTARRRNDSTYLSKQRLSSPTGARSRSELHVIYVVNHIHRSIKERVYARL